MGRQIRMGLVSAGMSRAGTTLTLNEEHMPNVRPLITRARALNCPSKKRADKIRSTFVCARELLDVMFLVWPLELHQHYPVIVNKSTLSPGTECISVAFLYPIA